MEHSMVLHVPVIVMEDGLVNIVQFVATIQVGVLHQVCGIQQLANVVVLLKNNMWEFIAMNVLLLIVVEGMEKVFHFLELMIVHVFALEVGQE